MIRNLKAHFLAVVSAALAISALSVAGAGAAEFTSAKGNYPVAGSGTSTADAFDVFGSQVKCTNRTFTGSLSGKSTDVTVTGSSSNCTAFGLPATVVVPAGFVTATSNGTLHIAKEVTVNVYASTPHGTPICVVHVPTQGPLGTLTYTNNADGTVNVSGNITGIKATQTRSSIFCPAGTETTTAIYTIQAGGIKVSGTFSGSAEGVHVK